MSNNEKLFNFFLRMIFVNRGFWGFGVLVRLPHLLGKNLGQKLNSVHRFPPGLESNLLLILLDIHAGQVLFERVETFAFAKQETLPHGCLTAKGRSAASGH